MTTRRSFIRKAALGAASLSIIDSLQVQAFSPKGSPKVISTWNFGIKANEAAWRVLSKGGRALDAVEQGVRVIESDPEVTSVGLGGLPDRDGHVTLDACIMNEAGECGSVAALKHIINPISVARMVMEKTPHVMLVGEGALQFALEQGFKKENLLTEKADLAWRKWLADSSYKPVINVENHDTIGMLAMDSKGDLSGSCTTSGLSFKMHGRVGDSPIIGAGLYVDNEIGAACATGLGEAVIRQCGSFLVVEMMHMGMTPMEACRTAVHRIIKQEKDKIKAIQVGFIAMNKDGVTGGFAVQKGFNFALHDGTTNQMVDADYIINK